MFKVKNRAAVWQVRNHLLHGSFFRDIVSYVMKKVLRRSILYSIFPSVLKQFLSS